MKLSGSERRAFSRADKAVAQNALYFYAAEFQGDDGLPSGFDNRYPREGNDLRGGGYQPFRFRTNHLTDIGSFMARIDSLATFVGALGRFVDRPITSGLLIDREIEAGMRSDPEAIGNVITGQQVSTYAAFHDRLATYAELLLAPHSPDYHKVALAAADVTRVLWPNLYDGASGPRPLQDFNTGAYLEGVLNAPLLIEPAS